MFIPFNKPHLPLASIRYLVGAALSGRISGNGKYTELCQRFFEERFGFRRVLLTPSGNGALEMAAILSGVGPGDEVILPSFARMSVANAFLLRGAKPVFCDTLREVPNIDPALAGALITPLTRVIVATHYSGLACDMDRIMQLAARHDLVVVEDAAHALEAYYKDEPLGSIGHLGTFSFHGNMNIISGEGGMLAVNQDPFPERAGSASLLSDALAAILYGQISHFRKIQRQRKWIWWEYHERLLPLEEKGSLSRPVIPRDATVNGNMFYVTMADKTRRDAMLEHLKSRGIRAMAHYLPLHDSPFFREQHDGRELPNTRRFSDTLLRLPFYYSMGKREIGYVVQKITEFFYF